MRRRWTSGLEADAHVATWLAPKEEILGADEINSGQRYRSENDKCHRQLPCPSPRPLPPNGCLSAASNEAGDDSATGGSGVADSGLPYEAD